MQLAKIKNWNWGCMGWVLLAVGYFGYQKWHDIDEQRKAKEEYKQELIAARTLDNFAHISSQMFRTRGLISSFDCQVKPLDLNSIPPPMEYLEKYDKRAKAKSTYTYDCFISSKLTKLTPDEFVTVASPLVSKVTINLGLQNSKIRFYPVEGKYEITYIFYEGKLIKRTIGLLKYSHRITTPEDLPVESEDTE